MKYPFPYSSEKFSAKEQKVLLQYFTNVDKPVFAVFNLPQQVVGAMFSRYSRSTKSVRRLFLDEFWSEELGMQEKGNSRKQLKQAQERADIFYKKVFAEFGDDSVIQMGGIHIAFEYISQLIGAKAVEDQRIGAAYIEKSTRYLDFGSKVNDNHYLFMEPPEIMASKYVKDFLAWNNLAFDLYNKNLPKVVEFLSKKYPIEKQELETPTSQGATLQGKEAPYEIYEKAYQRALKAKAFDTVRSFLPLTTVTNLGAYFSGQSAETAINKMLASPYAEVRLMGEMALSEVLKICPNFFQNINHPFGEISRKWRNDTRLYSELAADKWMEKVRVGVRGARPSVKLVDYDRDADIKIASQILYISQKDELSKNNIIDWCRKVKKADWKRYKEKYSRTLTKIIIDSIPDRKAPGLGRRQKLPRAFEHVFAEAEFFDNIGTYKDLQRNRVSSTERQRYSAGNLYIPPEYHERGMEEVLSDYLKLAGVTRKLQEKLIKIGKDDLVTSSEYVTLLGNKLRFNIKANIRQWVFMSELRTIPGGHPTYRHAMQDAASQIIAKIPFLKPLFTHVDWKKDYGLGRLKTEVATQERLAKINGKK